MKLSRFYPVVGLLLFVVAAVPVLAYTYAMDESGGACVPISEQKLCNCLNAAVIDIHGNAELLGTWSLQGQGSPKTRIVGVGDWGAEWAKTQPEQTGEGCTITSADESDETIHAFRAGSGSVQNKYAHVLVQTTRNSSGTAQKVNGGAWYWTPTVTLSTLRPVVETKVGSGDWTSVGVTIYDENEDGDPDPGNDVTALATATAQLAQDGNSSTPAFSAGAVEARFRGYHEVDNPGSSVKVRVRLALQASWSGAGLNAQVANWRAYLHVVFNTVMTSSTSPAF